VDYDQRHEQKFQQFLGNFEESDEQVEEDDESEV
jgi:hypothetical protein